MEEELEERREAEVRRVQEIVHERENTIDQMGTQVESLQHEVSGLTEFQSKLQEDFDTVQNMLEEKQREIEALTRELRPPAEGISADMQVSTRTMVTTGAKSPMAGIWTCTYDFRGQHSITKLSHDNIQRVQSVACRNNPIMMIQHGLKRRNMTMTVVISDFYFWNFTSYFKMVAMHTRMTKSKLPLWYQFLNFAHFFGYLASVWGGDNGFAAKRATKTKCGQPEGWGVVQHARTAGAHGKDWWFVNSGEHMSKEQKLRLNPWGTFWLHELLRKHLIWKGPSHEELGTLVLTIFTVATFLEEIVFCWKVDDRKDNL